MMRLFALAVGIGAGVVVGAVAMRRFEAARRAATPTAVADRLGRGAGSVAQRVRGAVAEGRAAAAARERELRARHEVPRVGEPGTS